jgi:hypothetical protein
MKKLLEIAAAVIIIGMILVVATALFCWQVDKINEMFGTTLTCPVNSK